MPAENDRRIDYIEFPVQDVAVARHFYTEVFGWRCQAWGDDYVSFEDGRLTGGWRGGESPVSGGPLVILYATDLAATEARIVANGGTITVPTFPFPGGRRFHFRDPCGHELAVWSDPIPGQEAGH